MPTIEVIVFERTRSKKSIILNFIEGESLYIAHLKNRKKIF